MHKYVCGCQVSLYVDVGFIEMREDGGLIVVLDVYSLAHWYFVSEYFFSDSVGGVGPIIDDGEDASYFSLFDSFHVVECAEAAKVEVALFLVILI